MERLSVMRVIVNADDLGSSEDVNEAIFTMMSRGRVTSATIMANGPALEHALRGVEKLSMCSFGIHLNLTECAPLTHGEGLAPILQDGVLVRGAVQKARPTRKLLVAAYEEWCAQVALLLARGVRISHVDSHHHVHTVPFLLPALKAVMVRFGLRRVRISKNVYSKELPATRRRLLEKRAFNTVLRHAPRVETTSGFTEFQSFYDIARSGERLGHPTLELMVHPGAQSERYARETVLLDGHTVESLVPGARLITYEQL